MNLHTTAQILIEREREKVERHGKRGDRLRERERDVREMERERQKGRDGGREGEAEREKRDQETKREMETK